jgi:hypothetical protein
MAFFRLQAVDRQHQRRDIPVVLSQPLWILLPGRQHGLVAAKIGCESIVGQPDMIGVLSFRPQLGHRPMTGKAAMTKPAQHIPAHTPAGHADGQFGFRAEGLPPTVACGVRTAHQTVDYLCRSRSCPQMMIAVVADMHVTVTDRTRTLLDIKIDPCEDGPCWPTIRHGGSTLVLKLVDGSHRVPTITYSQHLGKNLF